VNSIYEKSLFLKKSKCFSEIPQAWFNQKGCMALILTRQFFRTKIGILTPFRQGGMVRFNAISRFFNPSH
jgi:hypothetical protein